MLTNDVVSFEQPGPDFSLSRFRLHISSDMKQIVNIMLLCFKEMKRVKESLPYVKCFPVSRNTT